MLNQKQYIKWLAVGTLVFFVVFIVFFAIFYERGKHEPVVPDETIETFHEEGEALYTQEDTKRIQPHTVIRLVVKDHNKTPIAQEELKPLSLIGIAEEGLQERFSAYVVTNFEEDLVVLERELGQEEVPATYAVVIRDERIGILEQGETTRFIPLQLTKDDFLPIDWQLFEGEGLPITHYQKTALERQPYFIEVILQSYNE